MPHKTPQDAAPVSVADAAKRLGISKEATRKRLDRGTLQGVKRGRQWLVYLSDAEILQDATRDTEEMPQEAVQDGIRMPADTIADIKLAAAQETIARLAADVDYLRQTLDTEMEARRRADHLVAGLMERLPELSATVNTPVDTPQELTPVPQSPDADTRAAEPLKPVSDTLALGWRGWWRRMTGQ